MTWGALKEEIVTSLMEQGVGADEPTADLMLDKLGSIAKFVCVRIHRSLRREQVQIPFEGEPPEC